MEHGNEHTVRDSVLSRITAEGIAPKPAWHFLLREWVVWIAASVAFVVGSIATALSVYLVHTSLYMEWQIEQSSIDRLFELVPFFWLCCIVLALFYTIHAVRETRHGYRYSSAWLVVGALATSMLLGTVAEAQGVGAILDDYLISHVPAYQPLTGFRPHRFMNPAQGIHAGTVLTIDHEKLRVRTLGEKEVEVILTPETVIHTRVLLEKGAPVRFVGTTTMHNGVERFEVSEVGPFRGRGAGRAFLRGEKSQDREVKEKGNGMRSKE